MTFPCGTCGRDLVGPFLVDAAGREVCQACTEAAKPIACEHCGVATSPDDRLPTRAGGVADSACALRVTMALGLERSSCLIRRRMGYMQGGRS